MKTGERSGSPELRWKHMRGRRQEFESVLVFNDAPLCVCERERDVNKDGGGSRESSGRGCEKEELDRLMMVKIIRWRVRHVCTETETVLNIIVHTEAPLDNRCAEMVWEVVFFWFCDLLGRLWLRAPVWEKRHRLLSDKSVLSIGRIVRKKNGTPSESNKPAAIRFFSAETPTRTRTSDQRRSWHNRVELMEENRLSRWF
ncbi:hypothetical protein Q8A73_018114 [Channa argus]|nr:hypothetical protein Q8A73_018114 [Channa argus]